LHLPRYASELDVLFGPSYTIPLGFNGRSVVATHSINEVQSGAHPWWYALTYAPIYRWSAKKADRVIVPSSSTKRDLQAHYGIPAEKIVIVPEGAPAYFRPIEDKALIRATRERYVGSDRPYILFVGKLSKRRNIPILMEAFAQLKKHEGIPHALLLFGPNHLQLPLERMANELGIADSFIQTDGRVADHRELVPIYSAADLYVYPSSYDGFSLTLVEAMACGVPVVTTNRAALREIANGSALMVEDPTVEALTEAVHLALTDRRLNEELRKNSVERARAFRMEDTARKTLNVLQEVAQG
jgi:glycosyltransferase involved in cell wall biosynthesis